MFKYTAPSFKASAFNCPFCGAYANMLWYQLAFNNRGMRHSIPMWISVCIHCEGFAYWYEIDKESDSGRLIIPNTAAAPLPHPDMPPYVKFEYEEAREVVGVSPRSAAALLRLSLQKLCAELGESGENINNDIASLVSKGLPVEIQQALDVIRVVGNNAVHPGELQPDDFDDVAYSLFELINEIVEEMISKPQKLQNLFNRLPEGAREAIKKRDGSV